MTPIFCSLCASRRFNFVNCDIISSNRNYMFQHFRPYKSHVLIAKATDDLFFSWIFKTPSNWWDVTENKNTEKPNFLRKSMKVVNHREDEIFFYMMQFSENKSFCLIFRGFFFYVFVLRGIGQGKCQYTSLFFFLRLFLPKFLLIVKFRHATASFSVYLLKWGNEKRSGAPGVSRFSKEFLLRYIYYLIGSF